MAVLIIIGAATSSSTKKSSKTTSAPSSKTSSASSSAARAAEDAQAHAILARALKVIASDREDFHSYTLVSPVTLKNLDHSLRPVSSLAANGSGSGFFVSVRSASGTTFAVNGVGAVLTDPCHPAGAGCPGGHWSGPSTLALPTIPKLTAAEKSAVRSILLGSANHYASLLAQGRQALGTTQYPNSQAGLAAFSDPNSAASKFSAYQKHVNPANDLSSLQAFKKADSYFTAANEPAAISQWQNDMSNAQGDLGTWVQDAVSWQIKEISTTKLQADLAKVEKDLAQARADAIKASS